MSMLYRCFWCGHRLGRYATELMFGVPCPHCHRKPLIVERHPG